MNGNEKITNINTEEYVKSVSQRLEQLDNTVTRKVEEIINDAVRAAEQIKGQARIEAEKIKSEAEEEARKKEENLQEKEKQMKARMQEYWENGQKQDRENLNADMARLSEDYLKETKRMQQTHDEMCDETNAIQRKFSKEMEIINSKMNEIKSEYFTQLDKWKKSLYPAEVQPLARCYVHLYQIVKVDKLLEAELLGENPLQDTLGELRKLEENLLTFLARYERALRGLDLYVYSPKAGELFDDYFHTPEEEIDGTKKRIVECVQPGIMKKAQDENNDDVIIKAVVRVEDMKQEAEG